MPYKNTSYPKTISVYAYLEGRYNGTVKTATQIVTRINHLADLTFKNTGGVDTWRFRHAKSTMTR